MPRSLFAPLVLFAAALTGACGSNSTPTGPTTTPTQVSDTFSGTLTVSGAATWPFAVTQTGTVTATLTALSTDGAVVGLQLGTWNDTTASCAIPTIANDKATVNSSIIGTAASTANFCVRIYDVGQLAAPTDYVITVTHY